MTRTVISSFFCGVGSVRSINRRFALCETTLRHGLLDQANKQTSNVLDHETSKQHKAAMSHLQCMYCPGKGKQRACYELRANRAVFTNNPRARESKNEVKRT